MGLPSIRNVVARANFFLKNKFAAVIAGWDGSKITRVLRTDATGRLLVDASVSIDESPQVEVVAEDNAAVLAAATTPQTEFVITDPALPTPPPATRRFTVAAKVTAGNGDIIIEGRIGFATAWQQIYSIPIVAGGVFNKSYIPSWPRYRAYYRATINSTGVYFVVLTHPMV